MAASKEVRAEFSTRRLRMRSVSSSSTEPGRDKMRIGSQLVEEAALAFPSEPGSGWQCMMSRMTPVVVLAVAAEEAVVREQQVALTVRHLT